MSRYQTKDPKYLYYSAGGSLCSDHAIENVTQQLDDSAAYSYGHRYFIAESMTHEAAFIIAKALGKELK
jgi:hypothetical protein